MLNFILCGARSQKLRLLNIESEFFVRCLCTRFARYGLGRARVSHKNQVLEASGQDSQVAYMRDRLQRLFALDLIE